MLAVAIKPDKLSANKQPIADKINDNSNSSSSSRSTSNNMSLMFCSSVQWWAVLIFTWPKTRHSSERRRVQSLVARREATSGD
jgi:hypothetical protein